ncbi:Serpentine Receptor, class J [Caenorhabditis elegans]|uniref:Serpentine Receptor, class J n=1 Tax=Caenorhabditis elegans TaxID=6239 RepID=O17857_CAEEL|nr:Serpentine Receptor, class J [Caenorhabditis elegans]CAA96642.2 Serpentine Receptor, class J [Caenorhabditis elegans]|eukprot:NP_505740.2 Serpentine Receptor, class J [Caenorhabditis elegans]
MTLFCHNFLERYFLPHGIVVSVIYCLGLMSLWTFIAGFLSRKNRVERLSYIQESFKDYFGRDPLEINIIIVQYKEATEDFIEASWIGIGLLSVVSIASLLFIVLIAYFTLAELTKRAGIMSESTKRQQNQLMKALIVQTITPTIACFSPCFFSWYLPVFGIDGGELLQLISAVEMSAFPFFDPLSTILVLPVLRRQIKKVFGYQDPSTTNIIVQNRVQTSCL